MAEWQRACGSYQGWSDNKLSVRRGRASHIESGYHGDGEHDKEKPYAAPQIKKLPYGRGLCLSYEIFDRQNVFILSEAVSEKGAFA